MNRYSTVFRYFQLCAQNASLSIGSLMRCHTLKQLGEIRTLLSSQQRERERERQREEVCSPPQKFIFKFILKTCRQRARAILRSASRACA